MKSAEKEKANMSSGMKLEVNTACSSPEKEDQSMITEEGQSPVRRMPNKLGHNPNVDNFKLGMNQVDQNMQDEKD